MSFKRCLEPVIDVHEEVIDHPPGIVEMAKLLTSRPASRWQEAENASTK